jgi:hypothetical protein
MRRHVPVLIALLLVLLLDLLLLALLLLPHLTSSSPVFRFVDSPLLAAWDPPACAP